MCFFLAVETDVKYYQQAAKSHKAITFQDLSQGGTAPGGISPYVVTVCRFYATFIMLVQWKNKMIILASVWKRKGQIQKTQL